jgi:hypothetical protein
MRNVPHITKKNRVLFEDSMRRAQAIRESLTDESEFPMVHNVEGQRFVFLCPDDLEVYERVIVASLDWQNR